MATSTSSRGIFGNRAGALVWLEQSGEQFVRHELRPAAGAIHAFPFDADGDGDLDIAAIFSQNLEEVTLFRGDRTGSFMQETLFTARLTPTGWSGIEIADLDQDGDADILVTNGDYFDAVPVDYAELSALHGLAWLENDGSGRFEWHDIMRTLGAYAVRALDVDGDLDLDLLLSALRNADIVTPEGSRYPGASGGSRTTVASASKRTRSMTHRPTSSRSTRCLAPSHRRSWLARTRSATSPPSTDGSSSSRLPLASASGRTALPRRPPRRFGELDSPAAARDTGPPPGYPLTYTCPSRHNDKGLCAGSIRAALRREVACDND